MRSLQEISKKPFEEFKTVNSILLTKYCSHHTEISTKDIVTSIIGNSSLQHAARAMISASIVDRARAVSVCSWTAKRQDNLQKCIATGCRLWASIGAVSPRWLTWSSMLLCLVMAYKTQLLATLYDVQPHTVSKLP